MKKIFVINNDLDFMNLLQHWLEKKAYQVKYTGELRAVSPIMKEFQPDLVVIDILQREIIDQFKIDNVTCIVPVLLMTGHSLRQMLNHSTVNDTIEKPFDLLLFEQKIKHLIQ